MNKILSATILSLTAVGLVACGGGEQVTDPTPPSGSGSSSSSSSSSSSGSNPTTSSSGGAGSPTEFSSFTTSVITGESGYGATCAFVGCHGENGGGENAVSWTRFDTDQKLHAYIEEFMPKGNASACEGQCAADITAFLAQFRVSNSACTIPEDEVQFSERALPLLTPYEYRNAMIDLFGAGVPEDALSPLRPNRTVGFPNTRKTEVTEAQGLRYFNNANAIAQWNAQSGAVSCGAANASACADQFVNGFAKMAFRRPLQGSANEANSEIWHIHQIFSEAPSVAEGLRWAIIGTLTSPNFLYRAELGTPASEAVNSPLFAAFTGNGGGSTNINDYELAGPGTTSNGTVFDITPGGNGEPRDRSGEQTRLLWTSGSATRSFNFSDPSILTLKIGGNDYNGAWPNVTVTVGGTQVAQFSAQTPNYDLDTYEFLVTGLTGQQNVQIAYDNDGGIPNAMGEPGTDVDLYVGDVTVAPAQLKQVDPGSAEEDFAEKLAKAANDADAYVLDPYELASLLSFVMTGSIPDEALLDAAASGELNTSNGVLAQIGRLLDSPKAEAHMNQFVEYWFGLDELEANNALSDELAAAMKQEMQALFWHIFDDETVPYSEFFTADYSFLNDALAQHYGVNRNAGGQGPEAFIKTTLPSNRGGAPTLGAFLASFAHDEGSAPILRAVHVREDMLCHQIGVPPAFQEDAAIREAKEEEAEAARASRMLTTREQYRISTDSPSCGTCHDEDINPLGFAMEDFDGLGRFRTQQIAVGTEQDNPVLVDIDASGALWDPEIAQFTNHVASIPVSGARELSLELAKTQSIHSCLVEKSFRYAINRPINTAARDAISLGVDTALTDLEAESFACAQEELENVLRTTNQSPRAMFEAMGALDLMRFRK